MLIVTMTESFILFDNEYYRQNDGVAVGSPLGPTFTNIFICVHEILWLEKCPPEFRRVIYKGYVDDTFLLFHSINQLKNLNITLTSNMLILSLPLKLRWIIRYLFLTSKLLEKTTNSLPQLIESLHSVLCLLTLRVLYLTRTNASSFLHCYIELSNYALILNILRNKVYLVNFINFCIKKYLDNLYVKKEVYLLAPKKQFTCVLLFLGKKSLQFSQQCK